MFLMISLDPFNSSQVLTVKTKVTWSNIYCTKIPDKSILCKKTNNSIIIKDKIISTENCITDL